MTQLVASYLLSPWVLAAFFVAFHSWRRFDTPPSNRASTTPDRYYMALGAYLFAAIATYAIIGRSPELLHEVFPNAATPFLSESAQTSVPFFAALVVTILLPTIPVLCEPEERVRAFLQDLAAIPYQAMQLSKWLRGSEITLTDRTRAGIVEMMAANGTEIAIDGVGKNSIEYKWTRVSILTCIVRNWDEERRLASFRRTFSEEHAQLEDRYHQMASVVSMALAPMPLDQPKLASAMEALRKQASHQIDMLHKGLCDFVSRAVLKTRFTAASRTAELKRMGFVMRSPARGMFHQVMGLFMALGFYFTVSMAVFGPERMPIERRLLLGIIIAEIYCVAVAIAVWTAKRLEVSGGEERAWGTYLAAALIAMSASLSSAFGMQVLFDGSILAALKNLRVTCAWSLLAFTTALVTRHSCETRRDGPWVRWAEGIGQALVTAAVALLVRYLLQSLADRFQMPIEPPPPWRVALNGAVAGFAIGGWIPTWFRRQRKERESQGEVDEQFPAIAA